MKIAIVGLGLIGGSLAKAIKATSDNYISGYDCSQEVVKAALKDKTIDDYTENFSGYDMVIISIYPNDTVDFLNQHVDEFSENSIVVDCCGVKGFVCTQAEILFKNSPAVYIGGHPMAGREFSGYENSVSNLFETASMILTPISSSNEQAVEKCESFFLKTGFKTIVITTPEHHDKVIAYTSQLAHVVSSAYMQSPTADDFKGFSAGSFADLTRVAKLNPTMWSDLFLCNKKALCNEIDSLISSLDTFKSFIENEEQENLYNILEKGSQIKQKISSER